MNVVDDNLPAVVNARLAPDDGVFELAGPRPAWIWAHTCPTPGCTCRTALILASDDGRAALLERGAAVRAAWEANGDYPGVAAAIDDLHVFSIDIDSVEVLAPDAPQSDCAERPRIADLAARLDGEVLDAIGHLWYRGKSMPDPSQAVLLADEIGVKNWRPGAMLAWNDMDLDVRGDIYLLGDAAFEAIENYCPVPDCACGDVIVHFDACSPGAVGSPGRAEVQSSGAITLVPEKQGRARLEQLWAAFKLRHPRYMERFARRYPAMKSVGGKVIAAHTPLVAPPKVGRNDACPCGSGKKYKKCCAAH